MKRRRLLYLTLISGFGVLLLTTAKPADERVTSMLRWEHVNKTCRTRDCDDTVNREQLHDIYSYMNLSADPCESFHNYACGNWPRQHPNSTTMTKIANERITARFVTLFENWLETDQAEKTKDSIETIQLRRLCATQNCLTERKSLAEIKELSQDEFITMPGCSKNCENLDETQLSTNNWKPNQDILFQKLLNYYEVCRAQSDHKRLSLRPYFELIKSRFNLELNNFNLFDILAELGRFGYSSHFLNIKVVQKNTTLHRIVIYPHDIEQRIELNEEIYEILSGFTNNSQIELAQRFKNLEISLIQSSCQYCIKTPIEQNENEIEMENENENYELDCDCYKNEAMTFASLSTKMPEIDWQRFLSLQLGRQIKANEILEVVNFELLKQQIQYIQQIEIDLSFLYTIANFLNYLIEQQQFLIKYNSSELNCLHHMRKIFHLPMAYIYENAFFYSMRVKTELIVQQIFQDLKTQFAVTIENNKMKFLASVLPQLKNKLNKININIGNLPYNITQEFYYNLMEPYNFIDNFHYNHLHALEVFFKQYNSLLDVPETELKNLWHTFNVHLPTFLDNLDATPYYYARSNLIVLPYTYLQAPFFDTNFWPALIYGDLANTLGHEMIHAFDTEFLKYDANGNPSAQPLVNMFLNSNFCTNLNCLKRGTEFVRERIADVSGARLALDTYLKVDPNALKRNGELYFLQFAQFFCGAADPLTFKLEDPTHDIDKSRLNYVLGVVPEFAYVFNCPVGSNMNPVEKCEMYR